MFQYCDTQNTVINRCCSIGFIEGQGNQSVICFSDFLTKLVLVKLKIVQLCHKI